MNLPLKDMAGQQVGEIKVSDAVFAAPINKSVMHQALLRQLSNARLGTHKVKTVAKLLVVAASHSSKRAQAAPARVRHAHRNGLVVALSLVPRRASIPSSYPKRCITPHCAAL